MGRGLGCKNSKIFHPTSNNFYALIYLPSGAKIPTAFRVTIRGILRRHLELDGSRYFDPQPWWRHQMETFSALLALCVENSPVTGEFPLPRSVTRALMLSLICTWTNSGENNRDAGDLRRHRAHYIVSVMPTPVHLDWDVIMSSAYGKDSNVSSVEEKSLM